MALLPLLMQGSVPRIKRKHAQHKKRCETKSGGGAHGELVKRVMITILCFGREYFSSRTTRQLYTSAVLT